MVGAAAHYRAFISYSHRDAGFAARLHRRLEAYALPRQLGGARRLSPIFKDREELPAAADLSIQVRAALAASECLIVVCSPDSAASPWVGREIETFRALHPDRPILAALVRGEPAQAFPPALSAAGAEPLAADFRKTGDGERLGLLKLAAGLAGVGVDRLVQRDAQRRLRGVLAIAAASVAGMLIMGLTTAFALNARAEAIRQREAAETLVDSILTDIRENLKGFGQLRLRTAVNRDALAYYSKQRLDRLPASSLERRARVLLDIGEDDIERGDIASATASFSQAYTTTGSILRSTPNNPEAIWTHGQSIYWQGLIAYRAEKTGMAKALWTQYRTLAKRLNSIEPHSARSFRELANADINLCALLVEREKAVQPALRTCTQAVAEMERAQRLQPTNSSITFDVANSYAWLADAYVLAGQLPEARQTRMKQLSLLNTLLHSDRSNAMYLDNMGGAQRAMVKINFLERKYSEARQYVQLVRNTFSILVQRDPENANWKSQLDYADKAAAAIDKQEREDGGRR